MNDHEIGRNVAIVILILSVAIITFGLSTAKSERVVDKISNFDIERIDRMVAKMDGLLTSMAELTASMDITTSVMASWYGPGFHGRTTANGETYDMTKLTVAHPFLPFGTILHIRNPENGRACYARVNDRGPFVSGRLLDVSYNVAQILGFVDKGTTIVHIKVVAVPQ